MTFLESALQYESYGWSVIPLAEKVKVPPKGFEVIPYRTKRATKDQITKWWTENPNYNIGIITGKISNLFVVDIDTQEGKENIEKLIPESLVTPTAETPRGGQHLYFTYPKDCNITIGAGVITGTDFRGEGGYIVAAPSINGSGNPYSWLLNPSQVKLADLPIALYNAYILNNNIYRGVTKNEKTVLHSVTFNLDKGMRNESLYHIAHSLAKGNCEKETTQEVLNLLAKQCKPPMPENEIVTICNSAFDRLSRQERNINKEISEYIAVTNGYFSVTDCYNALQAVTKQEKGAIRIALSRLKDKVIEKHGQKDGVYKRIENDFEFVNFLEDEQPEVEFPITLPLGLNDIVEISQANIILVAGDFNAGKTTFVLNILKDNKGKVPIRYMFSEGGKSELKKRFYTFGLPFSFWIQDDMTEYLKRSSDFHMAIKPDAINIIDYLEFRDSDYTRGAEYLTQIQDKLTTGIAIVAVQKKEGSRMPRSGDMIVEKPRLALSFSKLLAGEENPQGCCEILKAKAPKHGRIDGKKCKFEILNRGSKFRVLNDFGFWRF